ncbi:MAG: metallophosphoesterase [Myxococcales bacterium]|nr:metallophosphoesterase [Myxococcales bacterium]
MQRTRHAALLAMGLALALAGCASDPNRLVGPNYGRKASAFVAPALPALPPDPALPDAGPSLVRRVVLIGDAGNPTDNEATLSALGRWGDAHAERSRVIFLGDNLYPAGLREDDLERGERVLRSQLDATRAAKTFTPGNHDWGYPVPSAENLAREEHFIDARPDANFLPRGGCPGPSVETLSAPGGDVPRGLSLVFIDLQWWLLPADQRPDCEGIDEERAARALADTLEALKGQWVIVAAHHPLRSGGPHGGLSYGWPTEAVVSMLGWWLGSLQNTYEPAYANATSRIRAALAPTRPLLYAAGHDHNLQLLEGGAASSFEVVSGAGSVRRVSTVTDIPGTLFAHAYPGFVVLDFHSTPSGEEVRLHVVETGREAPALSTRLAGG